jgi:hypothetical protein
MSGLFRRLAGQALGQPGATQLHALARLPYQAAPTGMVESPAPWSAEPQPATSLPLAQPLASESHGLEQQASRRQASPYAAPLQSTPGQASPRAAASNTGARSQAAAPPEHIAVMLEGFEPAAESPSLFQPAEPRRVSSGIADAAAQATPLVITTPQPAPPSHPIADNAPTPAASRRSATAAAALPGMPEQPSASPSLPEALLPPALFSAPRHASPAPAKGPAERQREPDEVHVHIGRIEITAVQQPAPAKRASRKGQAPLSLDDYLARRKGDGA